MSQTMPLLRASVRMMLRSRGVIYAMVSSPVIVAAFGLMRDLGFGFADETVDFFDFALPGMATFIAAISLQDTIVAVAASYKARGVLRRLAVTPVRPSTVVLTQIVSYLGIGLVAAVLMLIVGKLLGADLALTVNLLWLLPLLAMAILTALSISFIIAGLTPSPQLANMAAATLVLPLLALSGAVLPVGALPGALPDIVPYAVPYTSLIEAIRGIALTGANVTAYGQQVLVGAGWLALLFAAATRAYRFTRE
jgi:ABC-2 type transport system permease protein